MKQLKKHFFLSSTFADLSAERELVHKIVNEIGHSCLRMEDFPSNAFTIKDFTYDKIRESDGVILLIGERYGTLDSNGKSYSENEYFEAVKQNKQVFTFIKRPSIISNASSLILDDFKMILMSKPVSFWENEKDLSLELVKVLQEFNNYKIDSNLLLYESVEILSEKSKLITDIRIVNNLIENIYKSPDDIYKLSSRQFEELIAELFIKRGYNVKLTKATKDGGKDLMILEDNILGNHLIYGECKRYSPNRHIGVNLVRELYGTVVADRATAGVLVTSSYFSKEAKIFTEKIKHQMNLIDYNVLKLWLKNLKK